MSLPVRLVLMPFLVIVSTSLASPDQVNRAGGFVLWPDHPTLQAYRTILGYLNQVGLKNRNAYSCPLVREIRAPA